MISFFGHMGYMDTALTNGLFVEDLLHLCVSDCCGFIFDSWHIVLLLLYL